jgi:hypothetical protein
MTTSRRSLTLVALLFAGMLAGCAGATTQSPDGRGKSTIVTQTELATTNSDNLYDALAKLRPQWLTSRGAVSVTDPEQSAVNVYSSGTLMGKVDYLRQVRLLDVTEVRYWDAGQASARFGMGNPRGVIELVRK